jgi:hypothetical protein
LSSKRLIRISPAEVCMIAVVIPLSLSRLADHCVAGAVITAISEITALKGQQFSLFRSKKLSF